MAAPVRTKLGVAKHPIEWVLDLDHVRLLAATVHSLLTEGTLEVANGAKLFLILMHMVALDARKAVLFTVILHFCAQHLVVEHLGMISAC